MVDQEISNVLWRNYSSGIFVSLCGGPRNIHVVPGSAEFQQIKLICVHTSIGLTLQVLQYLDVFYCTFYCIFPKFAREIY